MLFLEPADRDEYGAAITDLLRSSLPVQFRGYSCHWESYPDDPGVTMQGTGTAGDIHHRVAIYTVADYLLTYIGVDPLAGGLSAEQWLSIPAQKLRTIAGGGVFRDDVGTLTKARTVVSAYYPRDVWIYMLCSGYSRLGQLSHFMGRCGMTGDELGSRQIAAQLVHDVMQLCFLLERTYAPYPKWFGRGFSLLKCAEGLTPLLHAAMDGSAARGTLFGGGGDDADAGWKAREEALVGVYSQLGEALNAAGVVANQPPESHSNQFWDRPFRVPNVAGSPDEAWVTTLLAQQVEDPVLKELCEKRAIGAAKLDEGGELIFMPPCLFRMESHYRDVQRCMEMKSPPIPRRSSTSIARTSWRTQAYWQRWLGWRTACKHVKTGISFLCGDPRLFGRAVHCRSSHASRKRCDRIWCNAPAVVRIDSAESVTPRSLWRSQ
jgi:hypothetical protein